MYNDFLDKNILKCVEELEKPSRAEIAHHLLLSRTTVSQNINRLIEMGIVQENDSRQETMKQGRPGKPLELNPSSHYALGAFFDESDWYFAIVNFQGTIIEQKHVHIGQLTVDSFLETLIRNILSFRAKYKEKLLPAVGIGSPGVIDKKTGTIVKAVDLGWKTIPLGTIISQRIHVPCYVDNRYRTSGLAEARYGQGKAFDDFIYLGAGSGFGTAIFINKELVASTNRHTGGISHIIVDPNGPYCECGRKGCLYPVGSSKALVNHTIEQLKTHQLTSLTGEPTVGQIMTAANKDDALAQSCVRHVADPLCIVIGHLINILNPQRIIIGGQMGMLGDYYCSYIEAKVVETYLTPEISIVQTKMDNYGGALGAATMVLDRKLELLLANK